MPAASNSTGVIVCLSTIVHIGERVDLDIVKGLSALSKNSLLEDSLLVRFNSQTCAFHCFGPKDRGQITQRIIHHTHEVLDIL